MHYTWRFTALAPLLQGKKYGGSLKKKSDVFIVWDSAARR
jgi:hypothetical protein